ncbi:MAG TPA: M15 family metallopeptidase [Syntrophomonadaceae bacterium]|mgnify:FL=1|nr:M15 family metallopeptidase [Syntrophomonadaceae bacterium]HQD90334.1 M15 family metallopeptidase [Syntrophomonadaceae bacterium]
MFSTGRATRKAAYWLGVICIISCVAILLTALLPVKSPQPVVDLQVANTHLSPEDLVMVNLKEYIPSLHIDIRYAGENNILRRPIYSSPHAYLRLGTAKKLKKAQEEFLDCGYSLKIWDAYRPPQAQFELWKEYPDARFLVNPNIRPSQHSHGIAVDVTLVDKQGNELDMPSGFDDFTAKADRDYNDVSEEQANNALLLEMIMKENGFDSIFYEWWHFIDHDRAYYDVVQPDMLTKEKE